MSTRMYMLAYQYCVLRDEEKCGRCGRTVGDATTKQERRRGQPDKIEKLELDHIDGNPMNNPMDGSNWRLLCRTCNLEAEMRGGCGSKKREGEGERGGDSGSMRLSRKERVREREEAKERELDRERGEGKANTRIVKQMVSLIDEEASIKVSAFCEPIFRRYAIDQVRRKKHVTKQALITGGAEVSGCAIITAKKYLMKLTGPEGCLDEVPLNGEAGIVFKPQLLPKGEA